MTEVILHVYDVTNSASAKTNNTILQINKIFKDGIGFGGIFHSAVQVFGDEEWSFGFCERGTGVFSCPVGKNPMYTYREFIVLGKTNFSIFKVNQILRELSREWPGDSYDLLARNCNHFCDELCERLGVPKLPAWVNRFANAGYAASEVAGNTALKFRQAKAEIVSAGRWHTDSFQMLHPTRRLLLSPQVIPTEEAQGFRRLGLKTSFQMVPNQLPVQNWKLNPRINTCCMNLLKNHSTAPVAVVEHNSSSFIIYIVLILKSHLYSIGNYSLQNCKINYSLKLDLLQWNRREVCVR
ncbi:hypothetical protein Syun_013227 [Stephania yunnanensis]|uniref:PPPDE domain-containing protein n=1 Tax=Stephania yunnanensis TaxID=152371 RepID=A0AAP0PH50_9MAGN